MIYHLKLFKHIYGNIMNKYNNEFDSCDKVNRPGMGEFYQDHQIKLTKPTIKQKQARGYRSFQGKKNIVGGEGVTGSVSTNRTLPVHHSGQFAIEEQERCERHESYELLKQNQSELDERLRQMSQRKRDAKERRKSYELLNRKKTPFDSGDRGLDLNDIRIIEEGGGIVTRDGVSRVKPLKSETREDTAADAFLCIFCLYIITVIVRAVAPPPAWPGLYG